LLATSALAVTLGAKVPLAEAETGQTAQSVSPAAPECRKAEVNPVTGHALCVEPLGAKVEAPPSDAMSAYEPLKHEGDSTYAPNCKDKPSG
jgi:hypothetical protein